jgi:hypothetical protein
MRGKYVHTLGVIGHLSKHLLVLQLYPVSNNVAFRSCGPVHSKGIVA